MCWYICSCMVILIPWMHAQPHIEKSFASGSTPTVDDIDHKDDIRHLSVRQLKVILVRNYVDIKGCVERRELEERLKRLWESRKREKGRKNGSERGCIVSKEKCISCVKVTLHLPAVG